MSEKNGFSVVAPMSTSSPSSTCGQQRVLLRPVEAVHLVEEQDRALPVLPEPRPGPLGDLAHVLHARATADSGSNAFSVAPATSRAIVVLPVPGGPHSTTDDSRSDSISVRSGRPGPTECSWPTTSSSDRGRSRAASGARSPQALLDGGAEQVAPRRCVRTRGFGRGPRARARVSCAGSSGVGRARERVGARLGLRERDHLADVLLAGEDRDEPVDAEREAGVRRRAVAEGVEQEPEPALRVLLASMPSSANTCCCSSGAWIRTLPEPSSQPLSTRSYASDRTVEQVLARAVARAARGRRGAAS